MDWYTLKVISGKEKKIRETILYDVSSSDLDDKIGGEIRIKVLNNK